jgi:type II secretory ATPase GspE/PulE/Tfp pilus assembly ATPase PilB-like protein
MQIKPKIGLTFATCLRHILRQDPDVVMIGEIRDLETARIAIQAALTGHLVVSTLHTNDSASAVTRLVDMGIEPYLVCSSLIAVMAQRLVRLVCPQCKRPYLPGKEERLALSVSRPLSDGKTFYKGAGCSCCSSTGYKGRSGIFELMVLDDELKELVITNARPDVIKQVSLRKGMHTLRQDGMRKVFDGDTTVEEVLRVTQDEVGQSDEELHTCLNLNTHN